MAVIVEYDADCPTCWAESKTVRKVALDPEQGGICCAVGHVFQAIPEFSAPKTEAAKPVQLADETAVVAEQRELASPSVADVSAEWVVAANGAARLPGRDLLFGLVIPETLADNLQAYAEEQKRPLAEILNQEVINILKNEWWR